jgi:hypothetical protein
MVQPPAAMMSFNFEGNAKTFLLVLLLPNLYDSKYYANQISKNLIDAHYLLMVRPSLSTPFSIYQRSYFLSFLYLAAASLGNLKAYDFRAIISRDIDYLDTYGF